MSTLTATKKEAEEFGTLTEEQIANLNGYDLTRYATWLLSEEGRSWSGRTRKEEDPKQFAKVGSFIAQTKYIRNN